MKFSDFPQEIKDKVKERIEEQGNVYTQETETLLNGNISSDKRQGSFNWTKTPEEYSFWNKVLTGEDFNLFFKKYPKDNQFDKPFQLNDIVKCINNPYTSDKSCIGKYFQITSQGDLDILNDGGFTALSSYPSGDFNEYNISFKSSMLEISARTQKEEVAEEGFREIPKDVKVGDKFVYCSHVRMDGSERINKLKIGTIVTLEHNDGTSTPYFTWKGKSTRDSLNWGYLKPHKESSTHSIDAFQASVDPCDPCNSDYFEIGDEVEVVYKKPGSWEDLKIGTKFVIEDFGLGKSGESFNNNSDTAHFNNNLFRVNWTKDMLKIVRKGNQLDNSNNKIHIQHGKVQQTNSPIILGFTLNLERGITLRGKTLASSNSQITVGN